MDIEEIRELVRLMVENDMAELDITEGENKIRLKRGAGGEVVGSAASAPAVPVAPVPAAAPAPTAAPAEAPSEVETDLIEIKSPMVGTFYASSSPDSESYVSAGATVDDETVICIIEAMKVMNEIKAECAGEVVQVCVKNAQPVEYGQVLFRVRPG